MTHLVWLQICWERKWNWWSPIICWTALLYFHKETNLVCRGIDSKYGKGYLFKVGAIYHLWKARWWWGFCWTSLNGWYMDILIILLYWLEQVVHSLCFWKIYLLSKNNNSNNNRSKKKTSLFQQPSIVEILCKFGLEEDYVLFVVAHKCALSEGQ